MHFERNIFTIANLALEANAYILLPTVLLHCCLRQMADILLGFGPSEGFYDELDPANKRAVLFAQQHLSCRIQEEAFPDLYDFEHVVPECHDVLRCCRAKGKLTTWMKCSPYSWGYATPTMETFLKNFKFCLRCREAYIMSYSEGRRRIWADLPQQFGLPDWTVLAQKTLGEAGLSSSVTLDFNCHSRIGPVSHAARETSPMIAMGHTQSPTTFINGYTIRPLLIEVIYPAILYITSCRSSRSCANDNQPFHQISLLHTTHNILRACPFRSFLWQPTRLRNYQIRISSTLFRLQATVGSWVSDEQYSIAQEHSLYQRLCYIFPTSYIAFLLYKDMQGLVSISSVNTDRKRSTALQCCAPACLRLWFVLLTATAQCSIAQPS